MPATRRTRNSSGPAGKGSQKTLSFGNSKVTKSSSTASSHWKSSSQKATSTDSKKGEGEEEKTRDVGHISSEAAVSQQTEVELKRIAVTKTEAEQRAERVTDAQIKRYWKAREAERLAARVHQKELEVEEKILRLFDMSSQYGPCIGIARMKRWVRAEKLGLQPPIEVLAVLLREEERGNDKIERAHVDDLMSSKFVVGEA